MNKYEKLCRSIDERPRPPTIILQQDTYSSIWAELLLADGCDKTMGLRIHHDYSYGTLASNGNPVGHARDTVTIFPQNIATLIAFLGEWMAEPGGDYRV
jgi:hypothetical protein